MPQPEALLLADWTDIIGYLVVIVFVVLRYVLTELGGGEKPKPKPAGNRPAPPPKPGAPREADLRSEVDEFLRRAKGLPPKDPEPAVEPIMLDDADQPARKIAAPLEPSPYHGDTVSEHVAQHVRPLAESQLAEQAAHLGEEVGLADEKLEARLKAKFEHRLGTLRRREEEPEPEVDPLAATLGGEQIAAMLANPEGVRNAIILNEILQRPTDRW